MIKYIDIEKAKAEMLAAFKADVEMYGGVEIVECFDAERANEILDTIPAANVRPPVSEAEKAFYTNLIDDLVHCAFETSGCGLCPHSDIGCSATRLKLRAANTIRRLLQEEEAP